MLIKLNSKPTSVNKWNEIYQEMDWKAIFLKPIKTTQDSKLRWFQLRIIHRIIPTNRYLCLRKITNNSSCSFGCGDEETIEHLFYDCPIVQLFWTDVLEWIRSRCIHCDNFIFTKELIIFGLKSNTFTDKVMDLIILLAKWHIYKCKLLNTSPQVMAFKNILKSRYVIEKYSSAIQCNSTKFASNWLMYLPLL